MNMFEEAETIRSMIKLCGLTQSEIAIKMEVSQPYVANKLRLLAFSAKTRDLITEARLTERHARLLLKLKDESTVHAAIEKIKNMHLSVAASEVLIDGMLTESMPKSIYSASDKVAKFEEIISESVANLRAFGINAKRKTDVHGRKKYITICIEE